MSHPLVSIIVPTYRRDDGLEKALFSISTQTYDNIEIIVVDDNDDMLWNSKVFKIVDSFVKSKSIPIQRIENHPNKGSAVARNVGIAVAQGEYIAFLDDDDIYLPNRIAHQLEPMLEMNADYSLTDICLYNEKEVLVECRNRIYLITKERENLQLCHLKYHMTGTDTMMFKAKYIKEIGGFEPIDSGDEFYLMMKAIQGKGKFCYVQGSEVKAYVHTGEEGLSSGKGKIDGENKLYKFKKQYFKEITRKDRRYIKMRHYAVLTFAYIRLRSYIKGVIYAGLCMLTEPYQCIKLACNRKAIV